MNDADLLKRYEGCAPDLCISEDENTCTDCKHVEQDTEVDSCNKHPGMYHDWDIPESLNFVYVMKCGDFTIK